MLNERARGLIPGKRRAFTLIELLVVIAIIAILAAILFPVFAQAREAARKTACLSNQKQMGSALMMYTQDFDEALPAWDAFFACSTGKAFGVIPAAQDCGLDGANRFWDYLLLPYVKNGAPDLGRASTSSYGGVWHCPSSPNATNYRSYGTNQVLMRGGNENAFSGQYYRFPKLAEIDAPASTVFVGDCGAGGRLAPPYFWQTFQLRGGTGSKAPGAPTPSTAVPPAADTSNNQWEWPDIHSGGANYVFCDGHAKYMKDSVAFPPGMTAQGFNGSTKAAYKATADYFAATASERNFYLSKAQ